MAFNLSPLGMSEPERREGRFVAIGPGPNLGAILCPAVGDVRIDTGKH